jgi:hypothetical protein
MLESLTDYAEQDKIRNAYKTMYKKPEVKVVPPVKKEEPPKKTEETKKDESAK